MLISAIAEKFLCTKGDSARINVKKQTRLHMFLFSLNGEILMDPGKRLEGYVGFLPERQTYRLHDDCPSCRARIAEQCDRDGKLHGGKKNERSKDCLIYRNDYTLFNTIYTAKYLQRFDVQN